MDSIPSINNMSDLLNKGDDGEKKELVEEIDEIFEGQGPYTEDFSVHSLSHPTGSAVWKPGYGEGPEIQSRNAREGSLRVNEIDLHDHRRDSFPHVHHPLQPSHFFHHRHKGKKKHNTSDDEDEQDEKNILLGSKAQETPVKIAKSPDKKSKQAPPKPGKLRTDVEIRVDPPSVSTDEDNLESVPLLATEAERLKSIIRPEAESAVSEDEHTLKSRGSRVQFDIGSDAAEDLEQRSKPHKRRKHRRHHEEVENPEDRRFLGNERRPKKFGTTTTEDEAKRLREHDLDEMSSHRFDDKGMHRRHHRMRIKTAISSIIHPSEMKNKAGKQKAPSKRTLDHQSHEVFVELSELQHTPLGGLEWKETARWIKYEEDVEGADNRWGKPHIPFLNFNALFSLRKGLERGSVLLDLDESDLPSIATRVVDHMVACDQIPPEQRDAVIKILMLRHKHIKEPHNAFKRATSKGSKLYLMGSSEDKLPTSQSAANLEHRSSIGRKSLSNIFHISANSRDHRSKSVTTDVFLSPNASKSNSYVQVDLEGELDHREKVTQNPDILKKIPQGAEATAVLVGAVDFLKQPTIAFVRLAEGVIMENVIEVPIPIRFLFVLLGPFQEEMDYHEVGRSISTLMSDKAFHEVAYRAHSRGQLLSAINEFLNDSIVFPPSEWNNKDLVPIDEIRAKTQEIIRKNESMRAKKKLSLMQAKTKEVMAAGDGDDKKEPPKRDPLIRVGKPFYGLIQDVKCRYKDYLSDITDGLSPQVLSASIFIFFASLAPAITFGGMYSDKTDRYIGVGETLLISSVNGMIFSLFAAQPLLIVGATGPLMIFDMSLYQFCQRMDIDFLSIRVWVGIWMIIIGLLVTGFELLTIVKKFTKFTEEIFSTLVCLIFIYGAFEKLGQIFANHPLQAPNSSCFRDLNNSRIPEEDWRDLDNYANLSGILINGTLHNGTNIYGDEVDDDEIHANQPNTALLSMCLMIGTFLIAWKLKKFRNSKYLGRSVRRALGDFGVPIAIFLMVLMDFCIKDTYTDKLSMPKGLQPSNSEVRGWLINPLGVVKPLPLWCMVAAGPAALLLFILIFLEENICHLILSKPERCLKKGTGFHLDIVLSCLINTISGFLGAPFMGPACVRTISHMSALTVMATNVAPGESPKIVGCIEQRVSSFSVSLLIGLSVMLYAVLNLVPTAVLLGIFLYMGISATAGIQLLERVILFFVPNKHHPNEPYAKMVRTWKMHMFTGIQVMLLVILWIVKQSPAALAIPFVLMCLIPIRLYLLPLGFTAEELVALDGAQNKNAEELADDEPDFYETMHRLPTQIDDSQS